MTQSKPQPLQGDMETQLHTLYEERQQLAQVLGTADAKQIIALVASLEAQLVDLYRQRAAPTAPPPIATAAE